MATNIGLGYEAQLVDQVLQWRTIGATTWTTVDSPVTAAKYRLDGGGTYVRLHYIGAWSGSAIPIAGATGNTTSSANFVANRSGSGGDWNDQSALPNMPSTSNAYSQLFHGNYFFLRSHFLHTTGSLGDFDVFPGIVDAFLYEPSGAAGTGYVYGYNGSAFLRSGVGVGIWTTETITIAAYNTARSASGTAILDGSAGAPPTPAVIIPSLVFNPATTSVAGSAYTILDPAATITDGGNLLGAVRATLSVGNGSLGIVVGGSLTITGTIGSITYLYYPAKRLLSITSDTATGADFQQVLRLIGYSRGTSTDGLAQTICVNLGSPIYSPDTGHYYDMARDVSVTWGEAKIAASAKNFFGLTGYLATITSQAENKFLETTFIRSGVTGGSSAGTPAGTIGSNRIWKWETGPEAGQVFWNGSSTGMYCPWYPGNPTNAHQPTSTQNLAPILTTLPFLGSYWSDVSTVNDYYIEYSTDSGTGDDGLSGARKVFAAPLVASTAAVLPKLIISPISSVSLTDSYVLLDPSAIVTDGGNTLNAIQLLIGGTTSNLGILNGSTFSSSGTIGSITYSFDSTKRLLSLKDNTAGQTALGSDFQSVMRMAAFDRGSSGGGSTQTITINLGKPLYLASVGRYYDFFAVSTSASSAATSASAKTFLGLTGHLANVTSATKNAFLYTQFKSDGWIGGSSLGTPSAIPRVWNWGAGPESNSTFWTGDLGGSSSGQYANWAGGHPSNNGNTSQTANNAPYLGFLGTVNGSWAEFADASTSGFYVEYSTVSGIGDDGLSGTRKVFSVLVNQDPSAIGTTAAIPIEVNIINGVITSAIGVSIANVTIDASNGIHSQVTINLGTTTIGKRRKMQGFRVMSNGSERPLFLLSENRNGEAYSVVYMKTVDSSSTVNLILNT